MNQRINALRRPAKRAVFIFVAFALVVAQLVWSVSPLQAAVTTLTYLEPEAEPQSLTGYPQDIIDISVRDSVLAVVGADGHVYTKDGMVPGLSNVAKAYVSRTVGYAIKTDGTLWSWGQGNQLGRIHDPGNTGANQDDPNPGQVTSLPDLVDIQLGMGHVLALDASGNVWSWGHNDALQLGNQPSCAEVSSPADICDVEPRILPEQVQGVSNVRSISAGRSGSVAVLPDDTLKLWGSVCNIETIHKYYGVPSSVPNVPGDIKQALNDDCSLTYLKNDGTVYSMAFQGHTDTVPRQITNLSGIESIATDGKVTRVARNSLGTIFRYGSTHNHTSYEAVVIARTGLEADYLAYDTDEESNQPGGAVLLNYNVPNERIFAATDALLFSFRPDGTGHTTEFEGGARANVSRDGTKLAYDVECSVFVSNRDGSDAVNITQQYNTSDTQVCAQGAVWSPDGTKLLIFYTQTDLATETSFDGVGTVNADGTNLTLLAPDAVYGQWSPDGTQIVLQHITPSEHYAVATMDADGSDLVVLPNNNVTEDRVQPSWSPDGTRLAYILRDQDEQNIPFAVLKTMIPDGSDEQVQYGISGELSLSYTAWSSDSTHIAFAVTGGQVDIYAVPVGVGDSGYFVHELGDGIHGLQWLTNPSLADTAPPVLGTPTWSLNPKSTTDTTTLTVPAGDNVGVTAAEYFIGDTDPGQGNGATMSVNPADVSTTFGTDFPTGVYKISVRAQDAAGNWSAVTSDYLVVFDPAGFKFTGKRTIVPNVENGDNLPGLIANNQLDKAKFGFTVKYNNQGQIHGNSDFQFTYKTGTKCNNPNQAQNCHTTSLDATNIEWLTTHGENNSTGIFQGTATLDVDGSVSTVLVRITGVDGERLSPTASDEFQLHVFDLGDNPDTDSPSYQVNSANIERGNIKIEEL